MVYRANLSSCQEPEVNYLLLYRATNSSIVYTLSKWHFTHGIRVLLPSHIVLVVALLMAGLLPSRDNILQGRFVGLRGCCPSRNTALLTVEANACEAVCWATVWPRSWTT